MLATYFSVGVPLPVASQLIAWHFPVALSLWTLSLFLLMQGSAVYKREDGSKKPRIGMILAYSLTGIMLVYFYFLTETAKRALEYTDIQVYLSELLYGFVQIPFKETEALSQALLFSSVPIGIMAIIEILRTPFLVRSTEDVSIPRRTPLWILVVSVFNLLQLAGSIATLIAFFR